MSSEKENIDHCRNSYNDDIESRLKNLLVPELTGLKRGPSTNSKNKGLDERQISDCYKNHSHQIFPKTSHYPLLSTKIDNYIKFFHDVKNIHESCADNVSGTISERVSMLHKNNRDYWAVAICTSNGQRQCYGTERISFPLQESAHPINYCLATEQYDTATVHDHIGFNPSNRCAGQEIFSAPYNPFTETGSLLVNALLCPVTAPADRFNELMKLWQQLVGGSSLGYSNSIYLSNKTSANSAHAGGYLMKEAGIFPDNINVTDAVDFLIQNHSMTVTTEQLAVAAATLANGGLCPLSGENVFSVETVRNCLSIMVNCGLGQYSGEFAFRFGLPAKSSVSGSIMISIPNTMGICLYSPRLNDNGHSARGIEFIQKFCNKYFVHTLHTLGVNKKKPRRHSIV